MAIYKNSETFYLNGVADPWSSNTTKTLPAHEFEPKSLRSLLSIYSYSFLFQCFMTIPTLGYALIRKIQFNPLNFELISLLAVLISTPMFIVWACTLVLRNGVSIFSLSTVEYAPNYSFRIYRFYALSGFNLLVIFLSAPWGDGWHMPYSIAPPVGLFVIVMVLASSRVLKLLKI